MELLILNSNLESIAVVDTFESFIWTDRYYECGDFEIYVTASPYLFSILSPNNYIWTKESDRLMIIEDVRIKYDSENGSRMVVTGQSIESLLNRRIVWTQTTLSGNLQTGIQQLLNENAISPSISVRQINNLVFVASTDPRITVLTVDAQFAIGSDLYESIRGLCKAADIAFKITLSSTNQFLFTLYVGEDRSYAQLTKPYVEFSQNFDNIVSSDYSESVKSFKNVGLVIGEGTGAAQKTAIVNGTVSGLARRETCVDASSLSQTVDSVLIPLEDYMAQLSQKGTEDLATHGLIKAFEGQIDTSRMYKLSLIHI